MRKIAFLGTGSIATVAAMFLGLPLAIGLGSASACGCEQRTADNHAHWESCARAIIAKENASNVLPTTTFVASKGPHGEDRGLWSVPISNPQFEDFLRDEVVPHCGLFADAQKADVKLKWWRDLYGYEELYIPKNASALLARADV